MHCSLLFFASCVSDTANVIVCVLLACVISLLHVCVCGALRFGSCRIFFRNRARFVAKPGRSPTCAPFSCAGCTALCVLCCENRQGVINVPLPWYIPQSHHLPIRGSLLVPALFLMELFNL